LTRRIPAKRGSGTCDRIDADDSDAIRRWMQVAIIPDGHELDPITGKVVESTVYEIATERNKPAGGSIVNYFAKFRFRTARN